MFLSCTKAEDKRLEFALDFAGTNRLELERVLDHYKNNTLKLKAARFLIENMPHYFSYDGWQLDSMKAAKATAIGKGYVDLKIVKQWDGFSLLSLNKRYDAQVITAKYLINNIDQAFVVWQQRTWNKSLSFDEFCELILPYRIGNEPLEYWRIAYYKRYNKVLDSLYQGSDIVEAANRLGNYLKNEKFQYNLDFYLPCLGATFLLKNRVGGCRESCDFTIYVMRALGFPTAIDIYHYSPENKNGHLWNVLKDTTGAYIPFWFMENGAKRGGSDNRKKGKVYRLCFGEQEELYPGISTNKEIPEHLKNRYIKDVTKNYFKENSAEIEVEEQLANKYILLGLFTPQGWVPIDIVKAKNRNVVFRNIEPNVIFQPLYFDGEKVAPAGYSFYLDKCIIKNYKPDITKRRTVELFRKYPLRDYIRWYMTRIVGAKIEASNTIDFKDAEFLYHVVDTPQTNYNIVYPKVHRKYRYIRYISDKDKPAEFTELSFYNDPGSEQRLPAQVIKGSKAYGGNKQTDMTKVNDGNELTYFLSQEMHGYVIFDLGKQEHIKKLIYIPRNDDNFIHIGDTYELFYQDGIKGWASLGKQRAKTNKLFFNNVPQNTLLWLHDMTRGQEEQVFYYKGKKQIFP